VAARGGHRYEERMRAALLAAGVYSTSAHALIGYQLMSAVGVGVALPVVAAAKGPLTIVLALVGAAVGWAAPLVLVRRKGRLRKQTIDRTLPDLIDMLVVTIEAGLGFAASLQAASTRIKGPLGEELRLMMQEQRMGRTTRDALTQMHERVPTPGMQSFVRSVTQGEALGVSIGTIMRNIAQEMRIRRRQSAEEQAQKAPVKMLFPLIFLMFPSLGIVILGPAIFDISDKLGGITP
jgi:tight adherence protein C